MICVIFSHELYHTIQTISTSYYQLYSIFVNIIVLKIYYEVFVQDILETDLIELIHQLIGIVEFFLIFKKTIAQIRVIKYTEYINISIGYPSLCSFIRQVVHGLVVKVYISQLLGCGIKFH